MGRCFIRYVQGTLKNCIVTGDMEHIQVGERQRRRKVAQLKDYARIALRHMETFRLHATSIMGTIETVTLQLCSGSFSVGTSHPSPEGMQEAARQTLYLLDRFAVSDEFYHEPAHIYTQHTQRKYKIVEKSCNSLIHSYIQTYLDSIM